MATPQTVKEQVEENKGTIKTMAQLIKSQHSKLAEALPKHMTADRLLRIILSQRS
jgi:hypothetical protein